jgi:hypothetical protein
MKSYSLGSEDLWDIVARSGEGRRGLESEISQSQKDMSGYNLMKANEINRLCQE